MEQTQKVFYLETHSQNPYYNLAFEEYVLTHRLEGEYLLLWQNDNTIVVGQNKNTEAEINRPFVEEHHINVVRRSTGGGAVYHDLGNLNYSFITDAGALQELAMQRFTAPVVEALKGLGLNAEASGRNDILVEGRKVSGTAQRVSHGRILHHGTLLFDSDPGAVAGALNVDPTKFQSKASKSVRSRIGNIREFLPTDMDLPAFWEYLKKFFAGNGIVNDSLSAEELAAVEKLKTEKYDTWEGNYGRSPKYNVHNKRRYEAGGVEFQRGVRRCDPGDRLLRRLPLRLLSGAPDRGPEGLRLPQGRRGGGAGPLRPPLHVWRHHQGGTAGPDVHDLTAAVLLPWGSCGEFYITRKQSAAEKSTALCLHCKIILLWRIPLPHFCGGNGRDAWCRPPARPASAGRTAAPGTWPAPWRR